MRIAALYDIHGNLPAAERIRTTDYPGAAEFADRQVLSPPPETEMVTLFSRDSLPPEPSEPLEPYEPLEPREPNHRVCVTGAVTTGRSM
jgi:hypothetical protein